MPEPKPLKPVQMVRPAKILLDDLLHINKMLKIELSRKTGIRPSTIANYCANLTDGIKLAHIAIICKVLKCGVSDLIELDEVDEE